MYIHDAVMMCIFYKDILFSLNLVRFANDTLPCWLSFSWCFRSSCNIGLLFMVDGIISRNWYIFTLLELISKHILSFQNQIWGCFPLPFVLKYRNWKMQYLNAAVQLFGTILRISTMERSWSILSTPHIYLL